MIRTLTIVFASATVGTAIGFGLMYLAVSRAADVTMPMSTPVACSIGWGNANP